MTTCASAIAITCAAVAQDARSDIGEQILVCHWDRNTQQSTVLFPLQSIEDPRSLCLSHSGDRIAFDAGPANSKPSVRRIHICSADGSGLTTLGHGVMPTWSPRGKRIAFSKYTPDGGVWVMRADGSDRQIIDYSGWSARWSPDGNKIAYTRHRNGAATLVIYNMVEDQYSLVWRESETPYTALAADIAWSPDNQRLLYIGQLRDGGQHLASVSLTDSRDVHEHLAGIHATPQADLAWGIADSITLAVTEGRVTRLQSVAVDLATARPAASTALPGQFVGRSNVSPCVGQDGESLLYFNRSE